MNNEEFAQKNTCCLKKVLVTGASGFIGSFLVEGGLEREMQVWAGVRKSSSRTYLKDPRIQFAELDFAHPGRLTEQLAVHKQLHGGWDYIIPPVISLQLLQTDFLNFHLYSSVLHILKYHLK